MAMSLSESVAQWVRQMVCRAIGHGKPEQRMFCRICSRCREVIQ